MRVVSVCSGAGGMDLGFDRAGFTTVALCEFDPWRQRLLARNFPDVRCWPDLAELDPAELPEADVVIGGTPCQDLSHAGQRAGLDGERSGLFFDYMRVRNATGVEWAVWENVEGALTSNGGLDFACVLGAFVGADVAAPAGGWPSAGVATGPWGGCVWRVLDAQHFGVPQRRRRVFVVGRLGGPCPPEVLLEPARGGRDLAQGERAWTDFAGPVGSGAHGAGRRTIDDDNYVAPALVKRYAKGTDSDATDAMVVGTLQAKSPDSGGWRIGADEAAAGHIVPALTARSSRGNPTPLAPGHNGADEHIVAATLTSGTSSDGVSAPGRRQEDDTNLVAYTLTSAGFDASEDGTGRGTPLVTDRVRAPDGLAGRLDVAPMTVKLSNTASNGHNVMDDLAPTLTETAGRIGVLADVAAGDRCAVDPQPDGRRYAACGDGVVAPVAEWIGRRLKAVAEDIAFKEAEAA